MPEFVAGIALNRAYFAEAVRPILDARFPGLAYSAALLGYGSDVLGYDTPTSMDHEWGPRLLLFLGEEDHAPRAAAIDAALAAHLPATFHGFSTAFTDRDDAGVRLMTPATPGAIRHHVEILTLRRFLQREMGFDPVWPLRAVDWLCLPQQQLLHITAGAVYYDGLGALEPLRAKLGYYPRDVWLYLLAAQWTRIAQEEAFMGRCGAAGDELGSRVVAARLVREIMRLCFLMERRYTPYSKWLGTAFARLDSAGEVAPALLAALEATGWRERERHLSAAYASVARRHNALGLTDPLDPGVTPYHDRPYLTPHAERFATALLAVIQDENVRRIVSRVGLIGAIDQWADSADLLTHGGLCSRLRALYE